MPCRRVKDEAEGEGGSAVSLMAQCGSSNGEPPVEVKPVARLIDDLAYLTQLTQADTPPKQLYRAKHVSALFVIGDASGKAKGAVVSQYGLDYESGV